MTLVSKRRHGVDSRILSATLWRWQGRLANFYFIEVRLLAGRFDTLTKQHLIRDFTKIIMLAEGKSHFSEDANRVWVHIVELQIEDWGIGGHTDWLRDYESALNVLGTEL